MGEGEGGAHSHWRHTFWRWPFGRRRNGPLLLSFFSFHVVILGLLIFPLWCSSHESKVAS